jgi:thiopeptide-type bacteriocin biosynthesis protein
MKKDELYFHEKLIVRSPSLEFNMHFTKETMQEMLQNKSFLESIYIASPDLYNECCNWKRDPASMEDRKKKKLFTSLARYYARMSTRCTPFGLFSGCSITEWNKPQQLEEQKKFTRHTRLDMHYLCMLSEFIAKMPGIKNRLNFFPNSSLYNLGDTLRYIEYEYVNGYRNYRISSVAASDYLLRLLDIAECGLSYDDLLEQIELLTGAAKEEAQFFLDEMVNSQVLVNELEPALSGEEFLPQLLAKLDRLVLKTTDSDAATGIVKLLKETDDLLRELDESGVNEVSSYKSIVEKLKAVNIPFEEGKLFQVDQVTGAEAAGPPASVQQQLIEAMEVCDIFLGENANTALSVFRKKFTDRYDSAEKPLLEVMDPECGIGFGNYEVQDNAGDLDGIFFPADPGSRQINWTTRSKYLFDKVLEAKENKAQQITLIAEELQKLATESKHQLPPSLSVMFRYFKDAGGNTKTYFETCTGPSSVSLMARFAHADPAIKSLCKEIAGTEQQKNSDIRFAEIVHLPERRTGNILLHPVFRDYEIPYLAHSSVEKKNQLLPENILVSVKGDRVVLRDSISGCEIIPRLSSAHNFGLRTLPAYHFLGSVQSQSLSAVFSFTWGALDGMFPFYPRVVFKDIILSPATWKLTHSDLQILIDADEHDLPEKMQAFLEKWNLPNAFFLSDGDNELLVYSNNILNVLSFLDIIKKRASITLKEFPCISNDTFTEGAGDFTKQYMAPVIKHDPTYAVSRQKDPLWVSDENMGRRFTPGSEWIYVKLYCGMQQADLFLITVIQNIVSECRTKGLIDKWFFIRYSDPGFHIRVRLHTSAKENIPTILSLLHKMLHPYINDFHIWKMQFDTYEREIERYGSNTIEIAENLFCIDSDAISAFLQQTHPAADSATRTLWLLKTIDDTLTAYQVSLHAKYKFMEQLRNSFAKELNAGKNTNAQIDARFRKIKTAMEKLLAGDTSMLENPVAHILEERNAALMIQAKQVADIHRRGRLTVTLDSLLSGLIHMTCNRLFATHARRQEFIMYDFLHRYYKSRLAIQGQNNLHKVDKNEPADPVPQVTEQ